MTPSPLLLRARLQDRQSAMRYESNECGQFHSSFSPPHSSSSPRACLHTCSTRPLLLDDDIWTDGANSIPRPAKRSLPTSALAVLLLRGCFCYLLAYDKRHSLRREAGPTPLCRRSSSIGTVHCGTRDNQCFVKLNFAILAPGLTWLLAPGLTNSNRSDQACPALDALGVQP